LKKLGLFASGALAGITASLLTYPLEFLRFLKDFVVIKKNILGFCDFRTRLAMQRDNFSYNNIINAVKIISKKEGYISFYSGLTITLVVKQ